VITGANTENFKQIVRTFVEADAVIQLPPLSESEATSELSDVFKQLLVNPEKRTKLGERAMSLVNQNRGATDRTLDLLGSILTRFPGAGSAEGRTTK